MANQIIVRIICDGLDRSWNFHSKKEEVFVLKAIFINLNPYHDFDTPNNTYKELLKQKVIDTKIIKDASSQTKQDYKKAVIDDKN